MEIQGAYLIDTTNKQCFVCNSKDSENPNLKFHYFSPNSDEKQRFLGLPIATFVCSDHLLNKIEENDEVKECFVCKVQNTIFKERHFFLYKENDSTTPRFICSVHFKPLKKGPIKMSYSCGIPCCKITSSDKKKFFYFPKDESKAKIWKENLRKYDVKFLKSNVICSRHFEKKYMEEKKSWTYLAVPTLYLNSNTESTKTQNINTCCIPSCGVTGPLTGYSERNFFLFPTNLERRTEWMKAIGQTTVSPHRIDSYANVICKKHFEPCFIRQNKYLTTNAVPTLHLTVPEQVQKFDIIELDENEEGEHNLQGTNFENIENSTKSSTESSDPFVLSSEEKFLEHLKPLYALAVKNDHFKAVSLLNYLENLFKGVNYES